MFNAFSKVKRFLRQARGLFPEPLPAGMTEFERWASSIASTYTLPTADFDSVKFAFASMIMHLGPQASSKPKYYFVKSFRAGAAKQIAGAVFHDVKIKQQEAMKAAQQSAEATAPKAVADVPHPIQTH